MICDNDKFPSNLSPDTIYDTVICSLYYIPIYEQVIATRLRLEIFSNRRGETYVSPIWHRHRLTNQLPGYEPADGIKNGVEYRSAIPWLLAIETRGMLECIQNSIDIAAHLRELNESISVLYSGEKYLCFDYFIPRKKNF